MRTIKELNDALLSLNENAEETQEYKSLFGNELLDNAPYRDVMVSVLNSYTSLLYHSLAKYLDCHDGPCTIVVVSQGNNLRKIICAGTSMFEISSKGLYEELLDEVHILGHSKEFVAVLKKLCLVWLQSEQCMVLTGHAIPSNLIFKAHFEKDLIVVNSIPR